MSSKKRLERKYLKSLCEQCVLRFSTNHPDGDCYDGVVMAIKPDFIVVCEERDWEFDGIQIFSKQAITDVRDGKYEACANRILQGSKTLSQLVLPGWLDACQNLTEVLQALQEQEIWPAVELLCDRHRKGEFSLGPIIKVGKHSFWTHGYGADGQWGKPSQIENSDVFRIEFGSRYCNHFNDYMKSQPVKRPLESKTKSPDKQKRTGK